MKKSLLLVAFGLIVNLYAQAFAVTFRVDMSNVTGFTVANVNGTFNNWCGACAPMTDANGDGVWEITINLNAGNYQYKFTYNGWTGQETLIPGSSCTVTASGFTNRTLAVTGDVVLPIVCYGACTSCAQVLPSYPVTFQVDMNQQTGFTTPELNGTFNNWCGNRATMTDVNGDGIWEKTITLQQGSYEYKFAADNWTTQENLVAGSACTVTTGNFTNRTLSVTGPTTLSAVCWGSCSACSAPPVNVTFQVDMNQYTGNFTTPEINGTFNSWCGNCNPLSDANGDNIWEVTLPLQTGTYEYKFAHDNWTGQETLTEGSSCTITTNGFTNRVVTISGPTTLNLVCWESCAACAAPISGCTNPIADNYNPSATIEDGSCIISGCTDMSASNYNANANTNDGTCLFPGCTDPSATNFNANANVNDGTCLFEGCTNPSASNFNAQANIDDGTCLFNTTFNVEMSCANVNFQNVYVTGPWCGWCGAEAYNVLTDADANGVYTLTLPFPAGSIEYKYMIDNWASQENLIDDMQNGASCAPVTDYTTYANRQGAIGSTFNDTYGQCAACGTPILGCTDMNAVNYDSFANTDNGSCMYLTTFHVDMDCADVNFTNVYVTGPWCGWCGAETFNLLSDGDGDGVFSGSVELASGNIEYKYMVDGWASQENLIDDVQAGGTCAPVTDYATYANRLGIIGSTFNDSYGQCVACGTVLPDPCDLFTQNFDDNTALNGWTPLADATLPEASLSWDATGAMRISGINTSPAIGKAYIFEYLNNTLNYNGNNTIELAFDVKAETALTGTALHLQTEFPGTGVTNTFDIQNAGINTNTWTHYSFVFNNVGAATLFRMHFNMAAGAFIGAGGTLLIDNIELNCYTPAVVPGCTDPTATNYNAAATEDDGSCTYAVTYNVTFQVDMQNVTGFTTPEVNGNFNGWCGGCAPMTDANGDNIWEITIPLSAGNYEYKFAYDTWSGQETLLEGSTCTVTNFGYTNHSLVVNSDVTLPVVCWSSCSDCGSTAIPVNVTFKVDMSQYTGTFTTPEVNGTFNGWCGNCNPLTDLNGDNIWETTITLLPGNYEYKFSHDAWTGQEELTPGMSCTITTDGFTNRSLTLTSDTTLQTVCWASCNACESVTDNNFYFYSSGKCENWIISVNMYVNGIISGSVLFDNGLETDTVETNSGLPIGGYLNTMNNSTFTLEILAEDIFGNILTLYGNVANGMVTSTEFPAVPFPITANNPITLDCGAVSELETQVTVFPNPTHGVLNVISEMALPINYTILDMSGRIVQSGISNQSKFNLSLENNAEGIYQLQLQNNSELKSVKIAIEK